MILQDLLRSDLCFKTVPKISVLHNTYAFPLKFHPTLPRVFIEALTQPDERVLDPMCGSGTTLIEAALVGRIGFGLDCDPLAVKLSKMKTSRLDPGKVKTVLYQIVNNAFISSLASPDIIHQFLQSHYSKVALRFFHEQFCEESILQLACLVREIQRIEEPTLKNFFEVVFSSIVLASTKKPRDTIKFFLEKGTHGMGSLQEFHGVHGYARVARGDVRNLPMADNTIDLVITAPPYGNAVDSVLPHRSSLYWLGVDEETLARCHDHYIGIQTLRPETQELQQDFLKATIIQMADADGRTAYPAGCILGQYFQDVAQALSEMQRVLKPGKAAVVVAGTLTIQGVILQTHEILSEIARAVGFQWVASKAIEAGCDDQNHNGHKTRACAYQEYVMGLVKRGS